MLAINLTYLLKDTFSQCIFYTLYKMYLLYILYIYIFD